MLVDSKHMQLQEREAAAGGLGLLIVHFGIGYTPEKPFTRRPSVSARGPEGSLHAWLANLFWTLHCVHSPSHEQVRFVVDLGYRWLRYTFSDEAEELFWDSFDTHVGEQEAAYGHNQQAAKRAGKGKTRHFRLALPLHNLLQVGNGVSAGDWSFRVTEAAVRASVLLSTYMDAVFQKLDLPRLKASQAPSGGRAVATADTAGHVCGGPSH